MHQLEESSSLRSTGLLFLGLAVAFLLASCGGARPCNAREAALAACHNLQQKKGEMTVEVVAARDSGDRYEVTLASQSRQTLQVGPVFYTLASVLKENGKVSFIRTEERKLGELVPDGWPKPDKMYRGFEGPMELSPETAP